MTLSATARLYVVVQPLGRKKKRKTGGIGKLRTLKMLLKYRNTTHIKAEAGGVGEREKVFFLRGGGRGKEG